MRRIYLTVLLQMAFLGAALSGELARLEPADGQCYAGANLNLGEMSPDEFNKLTGFRHAIFVDFFHFPIKDESRLESFFGKCKDAGAIALITLEPFEGLESVTEENSAKFADLCSKMNWPFVVRFAHEMNGSWYPWGQAPKEYVGKFRVMADAVHKECPKGAMLWAPNSGSGYPYGGGKWECKAGSNNFEILDTDKDGKLSMSDDMYSPYYPGDAAVDWVGMTIYHWGHSYPWGENESVKPNEFANAITGEKYEVDPVPDFYAMFCADPERRKPMMIPETSALFNTERKDGAGEKEIKCAWISQIYHVGESNAESPAIDRRFPKLKAINWFNHKKFENEVKAVVDWTVTSDPAILSGYKRAIEAKSSDGASYFIGYGDGSKGSENKTND
jgi:hypothetical protein